MSRRGPWILAIVAILAYGTLAGSLGKGFAIPTTIMIAISGMVVLCGPVGKALARKMDGTLPAPSEDLLAEMDELRARVEELEERVDFSERLLAQGRHEPAPEGQ